MRIKAMFLVLVAVALVVDAASADKKTGEVLASYSLTTLDGEKIELSSYRGDVVVVNFWASWCAPCRKELPIMNQWHTEWAGRGARVVAISIDKEARKARRFAEKTNLALEVFHDGPTGLAEKLDLPSLPCTFLLDRKGNVIAVFRGSSDKELAELHERVERLLGETPKVMKSDVTNGELK